MPPILIVGLIFAAAFLALTLVFRSCLAAAHDRQQELLGTYIGVIMEIDRLEQLVAAQRRDLEAGETERKNLQRMVLGEAWAHDEPDAYEIENSIVISGRRVLEQEFEHGARGMMRLTANLVCMEVSTDIFEARAVNWDGVSWKLTTADMVQDFDRFGGGAVKIGRRRVELNLESYAAR